MDEFISIEDILDEAVLPFVRGGWLTGLVVGVTGPGGRRVLGYGRTDGENTSAPGGDTVFNLGSVTKPFTGILLADLAKSQMVSLEDPAEKYLSSSIRLPRHRGRPERAITLLDLATHCSGLPVNPPDVKNFHLFSAGMEYPYERIGKWLAELELESVPGERYEYSNLGMGMLGCILARKLGMSYEDSVVSRICVPLGMRDTRIGLTPEMGKRLVQGHDAELNPIPLADYTSIGGAGSLRSTANDLLRFLEFNLGAESALKEAIEMTHEIRFRVDEKAARGLAWFVDAETGIVDHWGSVGGYRAYAGFLKSAGIGVVALSNTSAKVSEEVGTFVLRRLCGLSSRMPVPRKVITIPPDVLRSYEGCYELGRGMIVKISAREDLLWGHLSGEKPMRLWPETDRVFFSRLIEREIRFDKDGAGNIIGLSLGSGENARRARRVGCVGKLRASVIWLIGRALRRG